MAVDIQNLSKIYGRQKAVNDISFQAKRGEILGFLGPNGAGKTTTMKIITCFIQADAGTVTVNGTDVSKDPLAIRQSVGYLPEHNPLYLDMYVHEFLDFAGRVYKLDKKFRKNRIAKVIDMTGLGREQHKKIGMLSKGYRQRVGLCQALIHEPEVLILDEPTSGLDPNQIVEIRQLIKEVGKDKTVIFSSHILSEVEAIADRVVIIDRGKLIANESIDKLRSSNKNEKVIRLQVEKKGFDLGSFQHLEGVLSIKPVDLTSFEIRTQPEMDIRRALFDLCVNQDNAILSLAQESYSLEEAFRKLTGSISPS